MAEFRTALAKLFMDEGGWSNHPSDSGGETYRGISRNNWPHWAGWKIVDQLRDMADFPASLGRHFGLRTMVEEFYRSEFWRPEFAGFPVQELADKVLGAAVNMGEQAAVMCLQRACRACGRRVDDDGRLGPRTLLAVGQSEQRALLAALRSELACYHRLIVTRDPSQRVFLVGWLARDYST